MVVGYIIKGMAFAIRKMAMHPYVMLFTAGTAFGAVLGSGVLSKEPPVQYERQINVTDVQGKSYVVDLEKKSLEELTARYQKDSRLVELLNK
jgi:hypothetical protein